MYANIYDKYGEKHVGKGIEPGPCKFPFKYRKKEYTECLDTGKGGWCPTKITSRGYVDKWGYCVDREVENASKILSKLKTKKNNNKLNVAKTLLSLKNIKINKKLKKLNDIKLKVIIKKSKKKMNNTPIYFNSKSKEYYLLSNFYGGVESEYMSERFRNPEIKRLFKKFESCNKEEFLEYLKKLQPEKKPTNFWFKNGEPIKGILSKLVGNSVKEGKNYKKRLESIKEISGVEEIEINPKLSNEKRDELMLSCLRKKFSKKKYRDILLSTGNSDLHERPMRGLKSEWTNPGGDLLGKLLMQIRKEIRE